MEIQQLKGFLAVANYQSFTTAAEKTFRTQPAISLQVQALEEELGVTLIERLGPRRIRLTPEGKVLYELASSLVDDFESIKARFAEARGKPEAGKLTVVTHGSVMAYLLPEVIAQFKKAHPDCRLTILHRSREEIVSMVSHGEADLGITSLAVIAKNLDYKPLARFDRVLIASKRHALARKRTITLEDLSQYPLILPPKETNTRKTIEDVFKENGLTPTVAMEVAGREAVKTYVGMDLGVAILNDYYLTKEDRKKLVVKNVAKYFGQAERGIITRRGKYYPLGAREFIAMLKQSLK